VGTQGTGEPPERMPQGKCAERHQWIEAEPMGRPLLAEMDKWQCLWDRGWPMGRSKMGRPAVDAAREMGPKGLLDRG